MNKKTFTGLTGEDPIDMFGPDWFNILASEDFDPESEQEKVEILIDQIREDSIHNHGRR